MKRQTNLTTQLLGNIPISIIGAILAQFIFGIWWAASLDTLVKSQAQEIKQLTDRIESLTEELNQWQLHRFGK